MIDVDGIRNNTTVNYATGLINEESGLGIPGSGRSWFYEPAPFLLYTFNDASENNLIWLWQEQINVSIDEGDLFNQLVFPNPSIDHIIIREGNYADEFFVANINGQTVKNFTVETYPHRVNTVSMLSGIYFLRNKNNTVFQKFIKE